MDKKISIKQFAGVKVTTHSNEAINQKNFTRRLAKKFGRSTVKAVARFLISKHSSGDNVGAFFVDGAKVFT